MTSPQTQRVKYDNFSGGEAGKLGSTKVADGLFHGLNVLVYADGCLGPRAGLKDITPASMPPGPVSGFAATPVPERNLVFVVGSAAFYSDIGNPSTPVVSIIGNLDEEPNYPIPMVLLVGKLYTATKHAGGHVYVIDVGGPTMQALSASPPGVDLEVYGQRLMVAQSDASNRVFYSEAAEFNNWPAENYFDVGDVWQVTALVAQRQALTIFKRNGIFVFTGVPGINGNLRQVSTAQGPIQQYHVALDEEDAAWFVQGPRRNPSMFNGTTVSHVGSLQEFTNLRDGSPDPVLPPVRGATTLRGDLTASTTVMTQLDSNRMIVRHNDIWTRHETSVPISGQIVGQDEGVLLSDGGAPDVAAHFYVTVFNLNRPSYASDLLSRPGDASLVPLNAWVEFPENWSEDGTEVRVRQVIVDFKKWNTGADATNHFDLDVSMLGADEPDGKATETRSFDEPGSEATNLQEGTSARRVFNFYDDLRRGGGHQITMRNMRGIAIRRITVELDVFPAAPER